VNTITETLSNPGGRRELGAGLGDPQPIVQHNDPFPAQVQTDLKKIVERTAVETPATNRNSYITITRKADQTDGSTRCSRLAADREPE
jgi:hypothetical protein